MAEVAFVSPDTPISDWTDVEKLGDAMRRSLPLLAPELRERVSVLLTPQALAIIASVLTVWIGSHFFGVGFIADAVLLVVGLVAVGTAVFTGLDHLYDFSKRALSADSERDLDAAAEHFADAVVILGVEAVLAVLFRGAPRTFRGERFNVGPTPVRKGVIHRAPLRGTRDPTLVGAPAGHRPVGAGVTMPFGEIYIYRPNIASMPVHLRPSAIEQTRLAARHEAVHRALTPRLGLLWKMRVEGRTASYSRSSLLRFVEEALAETIAQVSVKGFGEIFTGVRFPVANGYVRLVRQRPETGVPLLMETGGVLAGSLLVSGLRVDVFVHPGATMPSEDQLR